jgi:hypothetical protein
MLIRRSVLLRAAVAAPAKQALFRFDPDLCHETLSVNERGQTN